MKNIYIIATLAFLSLTSCGKKEKTESENNNDSITMQDTMKVVTDTTLTEVNTTTIKNEDGSDVDLLDTMVVKTTTVETDLAKGRFALAETRWKLVELNGKAITNTTNKEYYINLDSKSGRFAAYAGCNNFSGNYTMKKAGLLAFSEIMGTRKACPNMDLENTFINTIEKTDRYILDKKVLYLKKGTSTLVKFEAIK